MQHGQVENTEEAKIISNVVSSLVDIAAYRAAAEACTPCIVDELEAWQDVLWWQAPALHSQGKQGMHEKEQQEKSETSSTIVHWTKPPRVRSAPLTSSCISRRQGPVPEDRSSADPTSLARVCAKDKAVQPAGANSAGSVHPTPLMLPAIQTRQGQFRKGTSQISKTGAFTNHPVPHAAADKDADNELMQHKEPILTAGNARSQGTIPPAGAATTAGTLIGHNTASTGKQSGPVMHAPTSQSKPHHGTSNTLPTSRSRSACGTASACTMAARCDDVPKSATTTLIQGAELNIGCAISCANLVPGRNSLWLHQHGTSGRGRKLQNTPGFSSSATEWGATSGVAQGKTHQKGFDGSVGRRLLELSKAQLETIKGEVKRRSQRGVVKAHSILRHATSLTAADSDKVATRC